MLSERVLSLWPSLLFHKWGVYSQRLVFVNIHFGGQVSWIMNLLFLGWRKAGLSYKEEPPASHMWTKRLWELSWLEPEDKDSGFSFKEEGIL